MRKKLFAVWAALVVCGFAMAQDMPKIVAHRGYWKCEKAGWAQNSLASLRCAGEFGAWGSEFDIHITADNVVVVNHDPTIDGIPIHTNKYAAFRHVRLKNGEKVPTLEQYLRVGRKYAKKKNMKLVVEFKIQEDESREDLLVAKTIAALKRYGLYEPKYVLFISFSKHICELVAGLAPEFTNQYLEKDLTPGEVKAAGINGIDYHFSAFYRYPEWVRQAHTMGMSVNCWTVDRKEDMQHMVALGVDAITTNEPALLRELLEKQEARTMR
ncbi:MAG: glycerophosphodiester phosphodiesterase [Bacteroidales bacterium]|nr:glycerophosphodiester phosphodiesterase [Bacteroidales bacterium]